MEQSLLFAKEVIQMKLKTQNSKLKTLLLLLLTPYSLLLTPSWSAFEEVGHGARPSAMGNAFTAVGGDLHAMYFNPAGLNGLSNPELTSMYSQLFMGLSDKSDIGVTLLGYGQPLGPLGNWGTFGIGFWRLRLDSLFSEQAVNISYGHSLMDLGSGKLYGGTTAKWLSRSFGTTAETLNAINLSGTSSGSPDPVFAKGHSKNAASFDLGLYYKYKIYSLGLSALNINQPNMALSASDKDVVPMSIKVGVSASMLRMRFALDVTQVEAIKGRFERIAAIGLERWWFTGKNDAFILRGGFTAGDRQLKNVSFGIGYQLNRAVFNYSFQLPLSGIQSVSGNHSLSFGLRFGRIDAEVNLERLLEQEKAAELKARQALQELEEARKVDLVKMTEVEQKLSATQRRLALEKQQARVREKQKKAYRAIENAYKLSWQYYLKRKEASAPQTARLALLKNIKDQYTDKSVDLAPVDKELVEVMNELKKAQEDFAFAWNYYKQVSLGGAPDETKKELLNRMLKKYEPYGIDLQSIKEEVEKLKR